MKQLSTYINEKLVLNKNTFKRDYKYFPKTKKELKDIIKQLLEERKDNDVIDLNDINTSKITNMALLFYDNNIHNNIHNIDISNWDVSSVQNMYMMFGRCKNLTSIGNVKNWNTSSVTNMGSMFYECIKFKQIDISDWDVSNVTNMQYMFYNCKSLKSVGDLSKWNTSSLKNTVQMFARCKRLNDIGDISSWNTKLLLYKLSMFSLCNIKNIPEWYEK